jgi:ADP-L-glycero-D-manno-heptose 6-epimerase
VIVITGAAGFIASYFAQFLNEKKYYDLVLVDDFTDPNKSANFKNIKASKFIHRKQLSDFLDKENQYIQFVFHLGARTDTTLQDTTIFDELNLNYSKKIWEKCIEHGLPLIYASSAATYGDGAFGYNDEHEMSLKLKPLNPYAESKLMFDNWVLSQNDSPYFWAGLRFFNVYGPNEYHKKRMASVVWHGFNQIKEQQKIKLFQSHKNGIAHGEQKRDFIYVKDICEVLFFMMHNRTKENNGIYNLGTGKAASFNELANALFSALQIKPNIEYISMPEDLREAYQYFTEANMQKLQNIGYKKPFMQIEQGVNDYVKNYLSKLKM